MCWVDLLNESLSRDRHPRQFPVKEIMPFITQSTTKSADPTRGLPQRLSAPPFTCARYIVYTSLSWRSATLVLGTWRAREIDYARSVFGRIPRFIQSKITVSIFGRLLFRFMLYVREKMSKVIYCKFMVPQKRQFKRITMRYMTEAQRHQSMQRNSLDWAWIRRELCSRRKL